MAANCKEDTDSVTRPYFVYAIFCVEELYSRLWFRDREWVIRGRGRVLSCWRIILTHTIEHAQAQAQAQAESCLVGESFQHTQ